MLLLIFAVYYVTMQIFPCAAQLDESKAEILKQDFESDGTGIYNFYYQTSNGIERNEEATYTNANGRGDHYVLTGFFSYRGPDGVDYKVKYTADKDGFHPEGDHFTVPPYTPWNIEYNENGEEIYSADFSNEGKIARLPKKLKEDTPEKAYLPAAENRRKRLI
ncbi:flexible cuticle protein 12-like isoform X2 [Agrilus planipennis]|uniref:Flexible cuticle protein 12-like isoform X2 n=1 Tax=Agrilus planipennis TaxID=224129 RepID=A0A7F5R1P3_AGRPL|nr:flexible cuticle protein 12-like isoform X2 [Agrilus planipennis]